VFSWISKLPFKAVLTELGFVRDWACLLELRCAVATVSLLLWPPYYMQPLLYVFFLL
jgi:hypothetical protein